MNDCRLLAKELIEDGKLTVERLADKAGRSFATANNWLSGRIQVGPKTIRAFERVVREVVEATKAESQRAAG